MKTEVVDKKTEKLAMKKTISYVILLVLVFFSALMVVFQVFEYRHDYRELSAFNRERDDLSRLKALNSR